jgi:hypothetical protein
MRQDGRPAGGPRGGGGGQRRSSGGAPGQRPARPGSRSR